MIYPIVAYGDPILRKVARNIDANTNLDLPKLIADMYETMYAANGVGLAAPQIGMDIRLFIVDGEDAETDDEEKEDMTGFKKVFINPIILHQEGEKWAFEEGCLSIPNIRENVQRLSKLKIRYQDEHWTWKEEEYDGIKARIIQHEYDHLEGVLFTDHLSALKKRLLKNKLVNIAKGNVEADYPMRFPK
jgi:peptide deformylase